MVKAERKELADLRKSMEIFKITNNLTKEEVMKRKNLPDNFELSYDYMAKLVFVDNNFDSDLQIDGRLWLRELFLQAQSNMIQLNWFVFVMITMIVLVPYYVVLYFMHKDEHEFSKMDWMYYGLTFMSNFMFLAMDGAFMFWA